MPSSPAIISQARMTSTRLPGKVLKKAGGKTLLDHHFHRLQWSGLPLVLATTVNAADNALAEWGEQNDLPVFRGDENDVLSRYYLAAKKFRIDPVIRVTSDCPLIDGHLIREAVTEFQKANNPLLYVSNVLERTFPRGFDFEVFSFQALEEAFNVAKESFQREHVTPYINRNVNGRMQFRHFTQQPDRSSWRLTVDTPDDFALIRILVEDKGCADLSYTQIGPILDANPELKKINEHIEQKKF